MSVLSKAQINFIFFIFSSGKRNFNMEIFETGMISGLKPENIFFHYLFFLFIYYFILFYFFFSFIPSLSIFLSSFSLLSPDPSLHLLLPTLFGPPPADLASKPPHRTTLGVQRTGFAPRRARPPRFPAPRAREAAARRPPRTSRALPRQASPPARTGTPRPRPGRAQAELERAPGAH